MTWTLLVKGGSIVDGTGAGQIQITVRIIDINAETVDQLPLVAKDFRNPEVPNLVRCDAERHSLQVFEAGLTVQSQIKLNFEYFSNY